MGICAFSQAIQISIRVILLFTREMRQHFPFFIGERLRRVYNNIYLHYYLLFKNFDLLIFNFVPENRGRKLQGMECFGNGFFFKSSCQLL